MIRARTGVELKAKLRRAMGWPDRRSWTEAERQELRKRYKLSIDWRRGHYTAEPIKAEPYP